MMKNCTRTLTDWLRDRHITRSRFVIVFCLATLCFLAATDSFAKSYSFTWSANPEPVEGYKLHYKKGGTAGQPFDGTGAVEGASPINVGKQTTYTISGLDDNATYYFALTAYNGTDESGYSAILTVQPASSSSNIQAPQIINIKAQ